jgi:hypothetical protein
VFAFLTIWETTSQVTHYSRKVRPASLQVLHQWRQSVIDHHFFLALFGSPNVEPIRGAELMAELVDVEVMEAGAVVADGEEART